jgi:hypothetical protein
MWCEKYQCICDATDCDGTSEDCEMAYESDDWEEDWEQR